MTSFRPLLFLFAMCGVLGVFAALALALPGDEAVDSGFMLTSAQPSATTKAVDELSLTEAAAPTPPSEINEPRLGSEELTPVPTPEALVAEQFSDGNDIAYNLNLQRVDEGVAPLELDPRLSDLARVYCPELGARFLELYDPENPNLAEALSHEAAGFDLSARAAAAGFDGWTSEILAWTAEQVEAYELTSGLWGSVAHHETLARAEVELVGAAGCRLGTDSFYVVVVGEA